MIHAVLPKRPQRSWLAWIVTASLMVAAVSVMATLSATDTAAAAPVHSGGPRPSSMGGSSYLSGGSSRHVPLPSSGPPPIPGEGPDLARSNHGHGRVNANVSPSSVSNGIDSSTNWSGLIDTGTTYTAVAGHWSVPSVQASTAQKAAATWIGISGFHASTLIQTGVDEIATSGTVQYGAWYELIPASPVNINEPVSPGDVMAAVINQTAARTWHIAIQDVTKGWTAAGTVTYTAGSASSAEWITERPTVNTALSTLADYGSTRFYDLKVSGTDLTAASVTSTYMTSTTGVVISYPGKFTTSTTGSFTDYYGTPLPTVTSVRPSQGGTAGGTQVTITGTYIVPTLTKSVHFGASAANATISSDGTITATSPAESAGTVNVTVTTTDGTSVATSADTFTYVAPTTTPPKTTTTTPPKTTTTTPPKTTTTTPPKTTTPPSAVSTAYDLVGADGGVFVFDAPGQGGGFYGSLPGIHVVPNKPIVGMVATANDQGYFLVAADGGVFSFGNAPFLGSLPGIGVTPAQPIAGLVATGTDQGYFLVGRDGGVFTFGNAPFLGSLPGEGIHVDDIVGIAATPSGNGYWLVASTGQVYAFGAAKQFGTALGTPAAVSAIAGTPTGGGYWITSVNGAVYAFGAAKSFGTLPASHVTPSLPVVGIVHTAGTGGYWLLGADGGIFAFGDAPFYGSLPGIGVHVTDIVAAVPN